MRQAAAAARRRLAATAADGGADDDEYDDTGDVDEQDEEADEASAAHEEPEEEEEEEENDEATSVGRKRGRTPGSSSRSRTRARTDIAGAVVAVAPMVYDFLKGLKANNEREWMRSHRDEYEVARNNAMDVFDAVQGIIRGFDTTVPEYDPKALMFRINRDIRFSVSKEPYKTCFSAAMSKGNKKSPHACYYIHIEPGASVVAGGMWQPSREYLHALRTRIARDASALKLVLKDKQFQQFFGKDPFDKQDALKNAPKGYDKDHAEIDFLRLKSFVVHHYIDDDTALSPEFVQVIGNVCKALHPLVQVLNEYAGL